MAATQSRSARPQKISRLIREGELPSGNLMDKQQVIKEIGEKNWDAFLKFMEGQTFKVDSEGRESYHSTDVQSFLHRPKPRLALFD